MHCDIPAFSLLSAKAQALDFTFNIVGSEITITGYTGPGGDVTIPATIEGLPVTIIAHQAFTYCSDELASVSISRSVTSIGYSAFNNCSSLTNITIPDQVTLIGEYVFTYCASLTSITVDEANPAYSSKDGVCLISKKQSSSNVPAGKREAIPSPTV